MLLCLQLSFPGGLKEMSRPFYTSTDLTAYPDFKEYAPEAFEAYNAFSAAAFAEGFSEGRPRN